MNTPKACKYKLCFDQTKSTHLDTLDSEAPDSASRQIPAVASFSVWLFDLEVKALNPTLDHHIDPFRNVNGMISHTHT